MTTNLERIQQMTADELAEWMNGLEGFCPCHNCIFEKYPKCNNITCKDGIKQWLEEESEK